MQLFQPTRSISRRWTYLGRRERDAGRPRPNRRNHGPSRRSADFERENFFGCALRCTTSLPRRVGHAASRLPSRDRPRTLVCSARGAVRRDLPLPLPLPAHYARERRLSAACSWYDPGGGFGAEAVLRRGSGVRVHAAARVHHALRHQACRQKGTRTYEASFMLGSVSAVLCSPVLLICTFQIMLRRSTPREVHTLICHEPVNYPSV